MLEEKQFQQHSSTENPCHFLINDKHYTIPISTVYPQVNHYNTAF